MLSQRTPPKSIGTVPGIAAENAASLVKIATDVFWAAPTTAAPRNRSRNRMSHTIVSSLEPHCIETQSDSIGFVALIKRHRPANCVLNPLRTKQVRLQISLDPFDGTAVADSWRNTDDHEHSRARKHTYRIAKQPRFEKRIERDACRQALSGSNLITALSAPFLWLLVAPVEPLAPESGPSSTSITPRCPRYGAGVSTEARHESTRPVTGRSAPQAMVRSA